MGNVLASCLLVEHDKQYRSPQAMTKITTGGSILSPLNAELHKHGLDLSAELVQEITLLDQRPPETHEEVVCICTPVQAGFHLFGKFPALSFLMILVLHSINSYGT
jgi:hypothetical protein